MFYFLLIFVHISIFEISFSSVQYFFVDNLEQCEVI